MMSWGWRLRETSRQRLSNAQKRESAKSPTPSAMLARDDVINVRAPFRAQKAGGESGTGMGGMGVGGERTDLLGGAWHDKAGNEGKGTKLLEQRIGGKER